MLLCIIIYNYVLLSIIDDESLLQTDHYNVLCEVINYTRTFHYTCIVNHKPTCKYILFTTKLSYILYINIVI